MQNAVGSNQGRDMSVFRGWREITLVKSRSSGDPDVIQTQGLESA